MLPLAVTVGDPSGVGPDIVLDIWRHRHVRQVAPFYVICDPDFLEARARRLGMDVALQCVDRPTADGFASALPVVPLTAGFIDTAGTTDASNARGVIEAIDRAASDAMSGSAAAIVTGPIAKKALYDAGFAFPGHTEYLAHLAGLRHGRTPTPVMLLCGPDLRAAPVTIHIPLAAVPTALTSAAIVETGRTVDATLRDRFGIVAPRLVVAGLNPHAGEDGTMGLEDRQIVAPAVEALRADGIDAVGPLPADTMFHARARQTYDAAICMYHDQALIPTKTLAFDETVNVTLGLPFVRTSPDHGTALALAGTGSARSDSFLAALRLARAMSGRAETS